MVADAGGGLSDPRRLRPLFEELGVYVNEWMADQRITVLPKVDLPCLLADPRRFGDLRAKLRWLEIEAQKSHRVDQRTFEAMVTLSAMLVSTAAELGTDLDPVPPENVTRAFLQLWSAPLTRHGDVTPPQVAAAYLAGEWTPADALAFGGPRWEPAAKVLWAMTYKLVTQGMHALAKKGVPPLQSERCQQRDRFEERVARATHTIALWTAGANPPIAGASIGSWRCWEQSLWHFASAAALGPGRAGGTCDDRPQPGAFSNCLFGRWCSDALGVVVGDVEQYFCENCDRPRAGPECPDHPWVRLIATWGRNHLVVPRDRLPEAERAWGHVEVKRRICKNPSCVEYLQKLISRNGRTRGYAQPIFDLSLDHCPYCDEAQIGTKPKTVWKRLR